MRRSWPKPAPPTGQRRRALAPTSSLYATSTGRSSIAPGYCADRSAYCCCAYTRPRALHSPHYPSQHLHVRCGQLLAASGDRAGDQQGKSASATWQQLPHTTQRGGVGIGCSPAPWQGHHARKDEVQVADSRAGQARHEVVPLLRHFPHTALHTGPVSVRDWLLRVPWCLSAGGRAPRGWPRAPGAAP